MYRLAECRKSFILTFTNETQRLVIPVQELLKSGKRIKGDFLSPVVLKSRRELRYGFVSSDPFKLIETTLLFLIQSPNGKDHKEFQITFKYSTETRGVVLYYQPLPLNCDDTKTQFSQEYEITSCCQRKRDVDILYVSLRNMV